MFSMRRNTVFVAGALLFATTSLSCGDQSGSPATLADTAADPDSQAPDVGPDASADSDTTNENRPPSATTDFAAIAEGTSTTIDILKNDSDPDGDALSITSISNADRGSASLADETIHFQAPSDYNGDIRLNYEISDGKGHSASAQLLIGVYEQLQSPQEAPVVSLPRQSMRADELGVIVNENDAFSTTIAAHYAARRDIPSDNIIRVSIPTDGAALQPSEFEPIRQNIASSTQDNIQGYLLTWLEPYRVGCMSITSALALGGYDAQYCDTDPDRPCTRTTAVDYFDAESTRPADTHQLTPAMMLALDDQQTAEDVIDRGVSADDTFPNGEGFFVRTTDAARSSRWRDLQATAMSWDRPDGLNVTYIDNSDGSRSNIVRDKSDVLFYFTGLANVADIGTNTYRPGAVADHLTSFAGRLSSFGGQMSAVEWLRTGVTASYGTVVEPCNFPQKFPRTSVLLEHYYRGNTILEAYWKSVRWPGEGVFIGEPLASPWGRSFVTYQNDTLEVRTTLLDPDRSYELIGRDTPGGSADTIQNDITVATPTMHTITVDSPSHPLVTLRPAN